MATITGLRTSSLNSDGSAAIVTWAAVTNGSDGTFADLGDFADKAVQVIGTLGVGGSISVQGSNDGTNFVTLTKPGGTAATFTALGVCAIVENTRYIKPIVTAGDGTTSLTAILFARRATPLHQ